MRVGRFCIERQAAPRNLQYSQSLKRHFRRLQVWVGETKRTCQTPAVAIGFLGLTDLFIRRHQPLQRRDVVRAVVAEVRVADQGVVGIDLRSAVEA